MKVLGLPVWALLAPLAACGLVAAELSGAAQLEGPLLGLWGTALVGVVLAAVHHAEVVAHRVGEPFGTLILALAITIIEVALIVSLMLSDPSGAPALARDTVFATVMIILNGVVGLCLLVGGARHREQVFGQFGVNAALTVLAALLVLTLILPNSTTSAAGPVYAPSQLAFVAVVSLILYSTFILIQTVRHRGYFLPAEGAMDEAVHAEPPPVTTTVLSFVLMVISLVVVVLLAKSLAPYIEQSVTSAGAPRAIVGVLIAGLVLAPESIAAVRAARANRLQTSLNLALGSALATIGLTIPAVAALSISTGLTLELGLDARGTVLLALTLLIATLSLATGRTTVLQGAVHLVLFAVFLFTTLVP